MGIATKRKIVKAGEDKLSSYINVPSPLKTKDIATIAADRLLLVDPRGEISEDKLHEFMEEEVEPAFWKWRKEREESDDG